MIEVGCCTINWAWLELGSALHVARDLGFGIVDVACTGPDSQINQVAAAENPSDWGLELRGTARRMNLCLSELMMGWLMIDGNRVLPNEPDLGLCTVAERQFRGVCQFAAEAGFSSILTLVGDPLPCEEDGGWARSVDGLGRMSALALDYGVQLDVEPTLGSLADTPEQVMALLEDVPDLRITLDPAQFVGQSIPADAMSPLLPYTQHVHAKAARPGWLMCAWHRNTVDYASLLRELADVGWSGVVAAEANGSVVNGYPGFVECSLEGVDAVPLSGLASSPITQTALVGHAIERILVEL